MAAITGTKVKLTEFSGEQKLLLVRCTPGSASDTITLTEAAHGITEITALPAAPHITAGADANLLTAHATFSGLVITLVTKGADGLAASDWTGASVDILVVGK